VILRGAATTLLATVLGMALALVIGLIFALCHRAPWRPLRFAVGSITLFLRATPLLVQLYFLFYVLPLYGVTLGPLATGLIGLGLHFGGYVSLVYRAGIDAIPPGQTEAALALGLGRVPLWTRVILPQALARVLPPLGNYFIAMFKSTPYLAAITVNEMLGAALDEASQSFRYMEPILIVGVLFLIASCLVALLVHRMERLMPVRN
jgi:polar amino acid transport system permease protein